MHRSVKMGCLAVTIGVLASPRAEAQEPDQFARANQFALSVERAFGFVHTIDTAEPSADTTDTDTITNVNLLTNPMGGFFSGYTVVRIGFDFFVIDGLSIGAALGYFTASTSSETEFMGMTDESDGPTYSGFLVAPRIGYAYMFNPTVGIWPRGGITYAHRSISDPDSDDESSTNRLAVTLELPLVISPVPHVGFLLGPTFDIGISGSNNNENTAPIPDTEVDAKTTDIGVQAGVVVYF